MTVRADIDQIGITPQGYIYGTFGANGDDAQLKFYDTATKAEFASTLGLSPWQAAEGVYYDTVAEVISGVSDGAFHLEASPALALGLTYDASTLDLTPV